MNLKSPDGDFRYTKEYFLLNYKITVGKKYMVLESDLMLIASQKLFTSLISTLNENITLEEVSVTNDITVSDFSVSRAQSKIKLRKDKVYVKT